MQACAPVLIIDPHPADAAMLAATIHGAGFNVSVCHTASDALTLIPRLKPAAIFLELDLPDMTGNQLIEKLQDWSRIPILMVTHRSQDIDIVTSLNLGAFDYILKPYDAKVLIARFHAALRKSVALESDAPVLVNGPVSLDLVSKAVYVDGSPLNLTKKEYHLFSIFMSHKGKMLTHQKLLADVWGQERLDNSEYVRVYVRSIRKKLEPFDGLAEIIKSVAGLGYRMEIYEGLDISVPDPQV